MSGRWFCILYLACTVSVAEAQEIDNTSSFRNINSNSYIRFGGDDDFLSGTDNQYTEGLNLEICSPVFRKFPLSKLLVHPALSGKGVKYGISIEQEGYTPTDLTSEAIATGDHPFAATLFLNTFMIVTDYAKGDRFASVLSTGVIGPSALGRQIQDGAHVVINDVEPPGWAYQIHDDVILNYEVNYEHQLLSSGHSFSLDVDAMARAGTFNDKICPGLTVMAGGFNSPFSSEALHKKFFFSVFDHPELNIVAYDATLQGGMFDNSSPYVLPASAVSRVVFKNFAGFTLVNNRFTLQYYHCIQTRQFITGQAHSWDGILLATTFR